MAEPEATPMLAQYQSIKSQYPDVLLFFRMGDFYELFFDDAVTASRELQIALTTRGKGTKNEAPMAGVPYHACQPYLAQLIDRGYSVAICDQMEDPRQAKGLVKRAVTRIVTPATILDEGSLDARRHTFLGAIFIGMHDTCGFAWADVSTGQWTGLEFRRQDDLWQWVRKIAPAELLLMDGQQLPQTFNQEGIRIVHQAPLSFELKRAGERLLAAQKVQELGALGLDDKPALTRACGAILAYLDQTQLGKTSELMPFAPLDTGKRLMIDEFTERNLEIFTRINGHRGKGTLRHLLDETITPMGGRLLEDMLRHPFRDLRLIRQIQEITGWLFANDDLRADLRQKLTAVPDLERIIMRICLGRANPRDFAALRQGLAAIPTITTSIQARGPEQTPMLLLRLIANLDDLSLLSTLLDQALADDPPASASDGGIFRKGYNSELDKQMDLLEHGEQRLAELLKKEQENLPRLRMSYNRVLGYYYELPRSAAKNGVPDHFMQRQSLTTGERYTTQALKELEESILLASERRNEIESEMFANLTAQVASRKDAIVQTADMIGQLDYWQSLAQVARHEDWVMPELTDESEIHIQGGRHPVVEQAIGSANFVPNDFHMDAERRLCLLTGPNMAGKSTVLRQVAIICLLAQMGSLVPANQATLGVVDRLFSRVGASDNLAQGQSTFMVEMMETARILRQATRRSLIILDEIGRGTSTYDGMSIAWAVVEELAARCKGQLRTIFATHYHELTALEKQIDGVFTMNIAVGAYDSKEILFLHRLVPGPSDKSYGVEVARLAGIPYPVVQRARAILGDLEKKRTKMTIRLDLPGLDDKDNEADSLAAELSRIDPEKLTPKDALAVIKKWKRLYG